MSTLHELIKYGFFFGGKGSGGSGGSGGGIFTIFIEENPNGEGYVIDKTYNEMVSARIAGMQLEVRTKETDWDSIHGYDENTIIPYSGKRYSLVAWYPNDGSFGFISIYHGVDRVYVDSVAVRGEWDDETQSMSQTSVYRETFAIIGEVVDVPLP